MARTKNSNGESFEAIFIRLVGHLEPLKKALTREVERRGMKKNQLVVECLAAGLLESKKKPGIKELVEDDSETNWLHSLGAIVSHNT